MFEYNAENQLFNLSPVKKKEVFFLSEPYYADFLRMLGLKEIRDGERYFLMGMDGKNKIPDTTTVASAVQQLRTREKLAFRQVVSMLSFVIEQIDNHPSLPAHIVSFMCRDVLMRAVMQRFNDEIGCRCANPDELSHIINDNVAEANETVRTMFFCDPSMKTGSFLVTMLNEMIAVKSQLGILTDKVGNPLYQYRITYDGNDLHVFDKNSFGMASFKSSDSESRRIQESIMIEKQTMVAHCLYGVSATPEDVRIARLRLWLELLKHADWDTMPVCRDNLRCGNALISRVPVQENLKNVFKRIGYSPQEYKKIVNDSQAAATLEEKERLEQLARLMQEKIRREATADERNSEELLKWQKELNALKTPGLFEMDEDETKAAKTKQLDLQAKIEKYRQKMEESQNNPVHEQAIEWRYDFPELLNERGDFVGFDVIIGNPPHVHEGIVGGERDVYKQLNYSAYKRTGEVVALYFELGNRLLRPDGFLTYLTAGNWTKSVSAGKMRQYLMEETNPLLLIESSRAGEAQEVIREQVITVLQKARNQFRMMNCTVREDFDPQTMSLEKYLSLNGAFSPVTAGQVAGTWTSFTSLSDIEKNILGKIEKYGVLLGAWDIQMYEGAKTGVDEAFIIDETMKDEFLRADYKNTDIVKPLLTSENVKRYLPDSSNRWLLYIPWHFPLLYDTSIRAASERAEMRFQQQYPVIYEHLMKYKDKLYARDMTEVGVTYEWYALQRAGGSGDWDDFMQQKVIWAQTSATSRFCMDYSSHALVDTTCFIIGQHLKYLLGVLNSKFGRYMLRDSPRLHDGNMQISTLTLEALKVPVPNGKIESEVISLVNRCTSDVHHTEDEDAENKIDELVFDVYNLSREEREFIETTVSENG
ncbi:MAG: hypothetical protein LBR49_07200 [Tannerella sp.]|jgi:hypothetical protein|nr:hypothetical protein [Tannerella sp.]